MITLELLPDTSVKPVHLGTVHHTEHGVAMALNWDFKCTWPVRRYHCGLEQPNYPMPVTLDDADRALNYLNLRLCPHSSDQPCNVCIEKFLDNIDYDYLYQD